MKDKKCKICKEKFKPLRSLQMVCSPSCGYEYTKQQKIKQAQKDKKKWHDDNMTVQDLMKLLQFQIISVRVFTYTETSDSSMHIVEKEKTPEEIYRAMFDESIIFEFDLTDK